MAATLAIPRPSRSVLVFVDDEALRDDVVAILARDGYDARGTSDELELVEAMQSAAASVLVVDVSSVSERTLEELSAEGRVPRIVVFSSMRGDAAIRLPFRPDVLRAAVSRAWRADDEPAGVAQTRRRRADPPHP